MSARSSPRERILQNLKTRGPLTAAQLGVRLGVTAMAVRQQLYQLQEEGIVAYEDERRRVGRPARRWHLTEKAEAAFPDIHPQLAVDLLHAIRATFGEEGLRQVLEARLKDQMESYRTRLAPLDGDVGARVAALTKMRREEGYMAEWRSAGAGEFEIIENHCAICNAARACPRLCNMELTAFQEILGNVDVSRTECIVSGDRRCVYEVRPEAS